MKVKEFSAESVKKAEAAHELGFDCIEKYTEDAGRGRMGRPKVRMISAKTSCDLDPKFFPELDVGDNVSVLYIMHFRECNKVYEEHGMYQQ